jgi:hypothetical protein
MKEMTDQELTDKISQVFDDFEDASAAHGWQELRKKYPEKHSRPVLMWWTTAAAGLLLFCGIWFFASDTHTNQLSSDKPTSQPQSDSYSENSLLKRRNTDVIPDKKERERASSAQIELRAVPADKDSWPRTAPEGLSASANGRIEHAPRTVVNTLSLSSIKPLSIGGTDPQQSPLITLPKPSEIDLKIPGSSALRDSAVHVQAKLLALARPSLVDDDHHHKVRELPYSPAKTTSPKNMLSFYAGSFVNYAIGSESRVNFGAGFTSDIKLGNKLRLSTGLALANNSLSYNNSVPTGADDRLSFDLQPSFTGIGNNNLTTVTKYDASLLALDIPVNVKYLIIPENNKLYMLAGFSSGTYLNEKYSLSYKKYNPAGFYAGQDQGSTVETQFQAFDFARTLNVSVGYSTPLGRKQSITVEPFLKYPLGGLGSENLRFGSTGLNIKLNFSDLKK